MLPACSGSRRCRFRLRSHLASHSLPSTWKAGMNPDLFSSCRGARHTRQRQQKSFPVGTQTATALGRSFSWAQGITSSDSSGVPIVLDCEKRKQSNNKLQMHKFVQSRVKTLPHSRSPNVGKGITEDRSRHFACLRRIEENRKQRAPQRC